MSGNSSSAHGERPSLSQFARPVALSYFFYFWALGIITPYLSPALLHIGFSKQETGLITAATYIFNVLLPVIGGRLTDRFLSPTRLIRVGAMAMALLSLALWYFSRDPSIAFLACLLAFSVAKAPMTSLQDTLALQVVADNPSAFARLRMAGSFGFAASSVALGYLASVFGIEVFFVVLTLTCVIFTLQSHVLPEVPAPQKEQVATSFWRGLSWHWWVWLLAMMLHWIALGPYHYGFTLLLQEQGVPDQYAGWFWVLGVGAEMLMFLYSGWFFARWELKPLLLLALGANLLRWLWIGLDPSPWVLATSQLLHGFGFGLFYAAAMATITRFSGGVHRASYQGLFATCIGGVAAILGSILAGWLHQRMPLAQVFLVCVPLEILAFLLMWWVPIIREERDFSEFFEPKLASHDING